MRNCFVCEILRMARCCFPRLDRSKCDESIVLLEDCHVHTRTLNITARSFNFPLDLSCIATISSGRSL